MEERAKQLEQQIDIENVTNYLRYRLDDTKDLIVTLKPYSEGTKQAQAINKQDAL